MEIGCVGNRLRYSKSVNKARFVVEKQSKSAAVTMKFRKIFLTFSQDLVPCFELFDFQLWALRSFDVMLTFKILCSV
jgi:hypothetical protein